MIVIAAWLLTFSGIALVGMGGYFVLARPALLPEDTRFMGTTVTEAIEALASSGPTLGRPFVDRIKGSALHNVKELRPTRGRTQFRILFVFDPRRQAVLLVAGDKSGNWKGWYSQSIPIAEERYGRWIEEQEEP